MNNISLNKTFKINMNETIPFSNGKFKTGYPMISKQLNSMSYVKTFNSKAFR